MVFMPKQQYFSYIRAMNINGWQEEHETMMKNGMGHKDNRGQLVSIATGKGSGG